MPPVRIIKRNYTNPSHPTSYSGIKRLGKYYNLSTRESKRILGKVNSYSIHRETKKPKYRNPFFIYQLRQQVQMDLIDVANLATQNDNTKFLLTAIDMFSKILICIPMQNKTGASSKVAVGQVLMQLGDKPKKIMTDAGMEFLNAQVQTLLDEEGVTHFTPGSDMKCVGVERVNKTLQRKIYQHMTEYRTDRYIDVLQDLVSSYNNSTHSSIGVTPVEAEDPVNHLKVLDMLNEHYSDIVEKRKKPKFEVGNTVRVAKLKSKFHRSYNAQQNEELYEIMRINQDMPIPLYYLKSLEELDDIEGGFYANELTLVNFDVFDIDRVLKRRTHRGVRQALVKWRGYHNNYNSWIPEVDLINLMAPR